MQPFLNILRFAVAIQFIILLGLAGCSPADPVSIGAKTIIPVAASSAPTSSPPITMSPLNITPDPIVTKTSIPAAVSPTNSLPALLPGPLICSPLEGISIAQLPEFISNPFKMNTPGLDDGHHGIDFAYYRYLDHVGMAGHPIQAVLPGRVAGLINNRPPYGYAVIIETPLENVDPSWINSANLPDPGPFVEPQPATNCPRISSSPGLKKEKSLYHLYAHMLEPSPLRPGQQVACGQQVGKVGTSGTSVNEHLHLETRVGPSGFTFSSLAYYDTSRTEKEAHDYCLWRVSNVFHLFNPAQLLDLELQPIP